MKRVVFSWFLLCAATAGLRAANSYTAHEWGTFTSVQGGDGKLLQWGPFPSSLLPHFVHFHYINKGDVPGLQRLETPVIYFHASHNFIVDVKIGFPQGVITENFPQANLEAGQRGISWPSLRVLADGSGTADMAPRDESGNHYFAAREARSELLRADSAKGSEYEKFLFYRGVGCFQTPLCVRVSAENSVTLENTGAAALSHLFYVSIHNGRASFTELDTLASHASRSLSLSSNMPLAQFQKKIASRVAQGLAGQGLFADEAKAMVDTWKDSWFTEEGERVFYLLPRVWTDEILPMSLSPAPEKLVRVMVGRAEILTPQRVAGLRQNMLEAESGDTAARTRSTAELKALGRFSGAALQLAHVHDAAASVAKNIYE
jgi:hypothetical protein